jgi:hypothetical protein
MTKRIRRLLSFPILAAMMLAMAAPAQAGVPEPSGFHLIGLEGLVRLGRDLITSPTNVFAPVPRPLHNALVFHGGPFGGIGVPFCIPHL